METKAVSFKSVLLNAAKLLDEGEQLSAYNAVLASHNEGIGDSRCFYPLKSWRGALCSPLGFFFHVLGMGNEPYRNHLREPSAGSTHEAVVALCLAAAVAESEGL